MSQIAKNVFDGFSIKIFRDEDGDWIAHFIEMPNVSAFADTPHEALDELELAWNGVKESYQKHGEDIPTKISQMSLQNLVETKNTVENTEKEYFDIPKEKITVAANV